MKENQNEVNKEVSIDTQFIQQKIYFIRGEKVMVDRDLAVLYGVDTGQLNRAVRRNIERFPEDFMFIMSKEEMQNWVCQIGIPNSELKKSLRIAPLVFTEQ